MLDAGAGRIDGGTVEKAPAPEVDTETVAWVDGADDEAGGASAGCVSARLAGAEVATGGDPGDESAGPRSLRVAATATAPSATRAMTIGVAALRLRGASSPAVPPQEAPVFADTGAAGCSRVFASSSSDLLGVGVTGRMRSTRATRRS